MIDNYKYYSKIDWEPPSTYGLNNSERIIPQHYFEQDNQSFKEIDMFYELTKDIRNLHLCTFQTPILYIIIR
jgi:hypothetical protein